MPDNLIQRLRDIARLRAEPNEPGGSPPEAMTEWMAADEIVRLREALDARRNEVIDECDSKAAAMAWLNPSTAMLGPEQNCLRVADTIRDLETIAENQS